MGTDWKRHLACPHCHRPFAANDPPFACSSCGAAYDASPAGIPIFLSPADRLRFGALLQAEAGLQMQSGYAKRTRTDWVHRLSRMLVPPAPVHENRRAPDLPAPKGAFDLWLGGAGLQLSGFVNVDIAAVPGVDLVANASMLPFVANCCDSVACLALLEHVANPEDVVAEMLRILKPGGEVHAVVPFCHPYHGFPSDYTRFSRDGLTGLFAAYENIEVGIFTGPTTTILTFLTYYIKLLFPVHGGSAIRRWFNRGVAGAFGWGIAPLRYLDVALNRLPDAHVLANHLYVTARKPG